MPNITAATIVVFFAFYAFILLLCLGIYVLNGIAILKLCKKINIENGFLGFVPIANAYKLGQIADKTCELQGQKKKYAKTLLTLSIITLGLCFILFIAAFALGVVAGIMGAGDSIDPSFAVGPNIALIIAIIVVVLIYFGIIGLAITLTVFQYIVYYKIFKFFKPDSALAFILLSIFISGIQPIFLLVCACSKEPIPSFAPNTYTSINPEFNVVTQAPINEVPQNPEN